MIKLTNDGKWDFHLLNLTDPQLRIEDWEDGSKIGSVFKKTVETLVERTSPDLITVSGDLSYADDFESYKKFAEYFDYLKIPWTCCLGNHDNENGFLPMRRVIDEYKKHKYFLFEECNPSLGIGNFAILIQKNGKNAEGIILMDTHCKIPYNKATEAGKNLAWAGLTPGQLDWYKTCVLELKNSGCNDTTLITHIAINGYRAAAKAAFKNFEHDKSVTLEDSYKSDVWNRGYEDSYGVFHELLSSYPEDEGALDLILELGSTKNILCGHNHVNNWVVNYKGVRFIFATKTGIGSYHEPEINGGTLLTVGESGVSSVNHEYVDIAELI